MSIEKLTANVSVHQSLGDEPNAENGFTADDLKRLFDSPAEAIKQYINDLLVPFLIDNRGDTVPGNLSIPTPVLGAHAANKSYVDGKIRFGYAEPEDWVDGDIWLCPVEE